MTPRELAEAAARGFYTQRTVQSAAMTGLSAANAIARDRGQQLSEDVEALIRVAAAAAVLAALRPDLTCDLADAVARQRAEAGPVPADVVARLLPAVSVDVA